MKYSIPNLEVAPACDDVVDSTGRREQPKARSCFQPAFPFNYLFSRRCYTLFTSSKNSLLAYGGIQLRRLIIMSSDEDDFEYDLYDPCSREHEDYKISQDNYADARRRYKYGNNVDLGGWNFEPWEEENKDSIETRLANAKEARAWAFE